MRVFTRSSILLTAWSSGAAAKLSHQLGRLLLLLATTLFIAGCTTYTATGNSSDFAAFLAQADAAQLEFQQGSPAHYKELWSHQSDVTLAGGFGGRFEQGWTGVSKRLDWASSQFRNGRNEVQRVASGVSGNLGYLVQTEHLTFSTPGNTATVERNYRVTMLFRREDGAWRIIHRHADSQNDRAAPK